MSDEANGNEGDGEHVANADLCEEGLGSAWA